MRFIKSAGVSGRIDAPPSKSMMQRAVIAATLAHGQSIIANPSFCDDALAAMEVARALGAEVERESARVRIRGGPGAKGGLLDCGESGTCMRMISAVAALQDREFIISGKGSLLKRPVGMVEKPLRALGAECSTNGGLPPLRVRGPIHGGRVEADGSESSQFVSGLLMALPLCREDSEVSVRGLRSRDYLEMTLSLMRHFGVEVRAGSGMEKFEVKGSQEYRPGGYEVEGDWSGAAFMLVAGAIAGEVEIRNLGRGKQPDQAIGQVLCDAGAVVEYGGGAVRAGRGALKAFEYDAGGSPDLFPPLAALACSCEGRSVIFGASRLRHKESDRAAVLAQELGKLGADIKIAGDRMEVTGRKLRGGRVNPRGDHRIAMAAAIAALNSEKGVEIEDEGCVSKSYPGFFEDLERVME